MEYLVVIGLSLLLITPMVIIFYQQSMSLEDDIITAQLSQIGALIIDAAEETYYLGAPTQQLITIHLPRGVKNITIHPEEVFFEYDAPGRAATLSTATRLPLNMSGDLRTYPGRHAIIIKATAHGITIHEQAP